MKKGLLLVIGVSASVAMFAQSAMLVSGVKKADLTLSGTHTADVQANSNFYAEASSQRNGNGPTTLISGTMFSSSYNANTLLVSQSNCMTANQALGVALFTHRISNDWSVAGVNSGYIQGTWTTNNGASWDSMYFDNDGVQLFRYPSGAILNPAGNTTMSNAWLAIAGPFTPGAGWGGYYLNAAPIMSGIGNTGTGVAVASLNSFPRIDIASYSDSSVWVTGALLGDDDVTGSPYRGGSLNHGVFNGTAVNWTMDSLKPSFHLDGAGAADCFQMLHLAFSADGQTGYAVFFGVQASASTPETRTFQPIVYSTTDGGATWSSVWAPYDYVNNGVFDAAPLAIAATDGSIKPWFSMSNGSDAVVDVNGNLHIICAVEWGSSDNDDSLGFSWNRNDFVHYIWDIHTTSATTNAWEGTLIDSLKTDATTTQSPFSDGSTPFDLDARIQASISPSRDHIFYLWADTDPSIAGGENAYPNLYGMGIDWSTDMKTATKQFTFTDDAYYHYNSNLALLSGSTYTVPTTNSIDRNGSHNTATTFDHYYLNNVTFDESEFTLTIGINEAVASFGTVAAYPNPANEVLNMNITLNNNEAVVVTMFNTLGQTVITEQRNLSAGANNIQLNTSNLEAGVYMVTVTAAGSTATTRVVVQ